MALTDTNPKESVNALHKKPRYNRHRIGIATNDTNDLANLHDALERNVLDCAGFDSIHGFVDDNDAGITLQPLEEVEYWDASAKAYAKKFVVRGANIGPLNAGQVFDLDTPGGGRWLLRVEAYAGSPGANVWVAGAKRANEGSIY